MILLGITVEVRNQMSQSQSFSGKRCIECFKGSFTLKDTRLSYTSSGELIQTELYICSSCKLMINCRNIINIPNNDLPRTTGQVGNPLTHLFKSSNPLKISWYH